MRLLLEHKAKVDLRDNGEHWTALMFAAAEGQADVVQLLLAHHANPSLKDIDGDTAAVFARNKHHMDVVRLLVSGPN